MESNSEVSTSTDEYKDCQEEGAHAYVARALLQLSAHVSMYCTIVHVMFFMFYHRATVHSSR